MPVARISDGLRLLTVLDLLLLPFPHGYGLLASDKSCPLRAEEKIQSADREIIHDALLVFRFGRVVPQRDHRVRLLARERGRHVDAFLRPARVRKEDDDIDGGLEVDARALGQCARLLIEVADTRQNILPGLKEDDFIAVSDDQPIEGL